MIASLIILTLLITLLVYPFTMLLIDKVCGTSYSCSGLFKWHNGKGGAKSFDGCSVHATCSKCGAEVMQDSQGNWF